jgi:hypothetical protein
MKLPKLERYNQIVWAVVGTGVVVVAAVSILAVAAAMLYALIKSDSGVPVAVVDDNGSDDTQREAARYDFCHPVAVAGSPYQLIRVASDRVVVRNTPAKLRKRGYDSYSSEADTYNSCGLYGNNDPTAIVNVLVRHADTGAVHLVLKENAVVQTLEYPQPRTGRDDPDSANTFPPAGVLYWEIASEDSNGDGVIDEEDDVGTYLSDIDGRNLARITPKPSRVLEKTYDKKRNTLLLRILPDTNGDGNLDDNDTPTLMESSAQRKIMREVLNNKALAEVMHEAEPKGQKKPRQSDRRWTD